MEVDGGLGQVAIKSTSMQPVEQPDAVLPPSTNMLPPSPVPLARRQSLMPPEWTVELDPATGGQYFYNTLTGESTWERPKLAYHGDV